MQVHVTRQPYSNAQVSVYESIGQTWWATSVDMKAIHTVFIHDKNPLISSASPLHEETDRWCTHSLTCSPPYWYFKKSGRRVYGNPTIQQAVRKTVWATATKNPLPPRDTWTAPERRHDEHKADQRKVDRVCQRPLIERPSQTPGGKSVCNDPDEQEDEKRARQPLYPVNGC